MAVTPTAEKFAEKPGQHSMLVTWEGITTSGDGSGSEEYELLYFGPLASVQMVGTFGGATVTLQGSNDGANWVALKDVAGDAVALTSAGLVEISVTCRWVRVLSASGSSDDVDVFLVLR